MLQREETQGEMKLDQIAKLEKKLQQQKNKLQQREAYLREQKRKKVQEKALEEKQSYLPSFSPSDL